MPNTRFGSSPRVRGTRRPGAQAPPAAPVHPRVCGELCSAAKRCASTTGSSPRVRGTRRRLLPVLRAGRFIPACAGNSGTSGAARGSPPVHPRVCGELSYWCALRTPPIGSSPRVRGTRVAIVDCDGEVRFIPACAGNSSSRRYFVRGSSGSSPRVRGTPTAWPRRTSAARFIPACAGNSRARPAPGSLAPVHPRVCGELASRASTPAASNGSSPRVRGTPQERFDPPPAVRFIPACAGNSIAGNGTQLNVNGSSPRVRGTRHLVHRDRDLVRFIPACAGNSSMANVMSCSTTVHPRVCGELARLGRSGG